MIRSVRSWSSFPVPRPLAAGLLAAAASVGAPLALAAESPARSSSPAAPGMAAPGTAAQGPAAPSMPGASPEAAPSRPAPSAGRGALLYDTHCIACHTEQVHWRDARLVRDWPSLTAQVTRWQANTGLGWSAQDIDEVARYLNRRYYRMPDEPRPPGRS